MIVPDFVAIKLAQQAMQNSLQLPEKPAPEPKPKPTNPAPKPGLWRPVKSLKRILSGR